MNSHMETAAPCNNSCLFGLHKERFTCVEAGIFGLLDVSCKLDKSVWMAGLCTLSTTLAKLLVRNGPAVCF